MMLIAFLSLMSSVSCVNHHEEQTQIQQIECPDAGYRIGNNTINVEKVASKGKVRSVNRAPVYSMVDGVIVNMNLVEGQRVKKGEVLATIDMSETKASILELESNLQMAEYEVRTSLIGLGYNPDELEAVPVDVLRDVRTRTGYSQIKVKLENQKELMRFREIRAPFNGSIMDINAGCMCYARKGEPLFYIMDTDNLIVRFEILEPMLTHFSIGMPLEFTTLCFGDKVYKAELQSIAPNVESNGVVVMTAAIKEKYPEILPGMTCFVNE